MASVNSGHYVRGRDTHRVTKRTLGKTIVALRDARGISQPELAKRVGIKQPSLSNIENDKTKRLRGETLAGLCRELGVSPDVLLNPSIAVAPPAEAAELVLIYRSLTTDYQGHLIATARAFRERMQPARKGPAISIATSTVQDATVTGEHASPKQTTIVHRRKA